MSIKKFTVSRNDEKYEAWPDLIRTRSGKLLCIFAECEHHKLRLDTRLTILESTDRGRTWGGKRYLTEPFDDGSYYNNARLARMHDDTLIITCDRVYGPMLKVPE